ncbi:peroxisomal targeting signal 2 receptor [Condylostylus longicornis]|uniref:peroxisomal targeting signal 2 receptor n=1 Tax=Condylostylus longicornis TaxID=2530218 RepID=UPI00244D9F7B|nr:peroxisomal targeting signal 2 receptor [Condylostylus longicornis]
MPSIKTPNRHGYSVKFSPFHSRNIVVATSQQYGMSGNGTLFYFSYDDENISFIRQYEWDDGLFDVAWSNLNENLVVTSSGDGIMQLWDLNSPLKNPKPIQLYSEHNAEIYSLDWGSFWHSNNILSASWDNKLKIWDPTRGNSLSTFVMNRSSISSQSTLITNDILIYQAAYAPFIPNIFSSVSTDGNLCLWNSLDFSGNPIGKIKVHNEEALSLDWNKFNHWMLATGGSDGLIRCWDIRNIKDDSPVYEFLGSELMAIRKIKYSQCLPNILATTSFDCTTRIWDIENQEESIQILKDHDECIYGLDWSYNRDDLIVDCGWDSKININSVTSLIK